MTGSMFLTFFVSLAAMLTLAATLFHVELAGKRIDSRLRELRLTSLAGLPYCS